MATMENDRRRTPFAPGTVSTRHHATGGPRTTTMKPGTDRAMAENAAALLENPTFQDVMAQLTQTAHDTFENSPIGSAGHSVRETAHLQLAAMKRIREQLQAMAADAKIHERMEAQQAEHE